MLDPVNEAKALAALSILITKLGENSPTGGKEIFFPDMILSELSPKGQIQIGQYPDKPGFFIRYFHNKTIAAAVESPKTDIIPID